MTLLSLDSIFDKEFYEKVVIIAKNARLIAEKKPPLDRDSYHIHTQAVECFFRKQYQATVFFASIGVERYLNKALKKRKWHNLNASLIMESYDSSIKAVTELLDASEKTVLRTRKPKPLFCERRNKILHGEFEGLVKTKAPEVEHTKAFPIIYFLISAYDQLLRFQKFLLRI